VKQVAIKNTIRIAGALALASLSCASCSSIRGIFAADSSKDGSKPISNPFGNYQPGTSENPAESMIFRAKRGDKAVEVEIPRANQGVTDFVLPVPHGSSASRGLASVADDEGNLPPPSPSESAYESQAPTATDRELTRSFSQAPFEEAQKRNDIEKGLGLVETPEASPERERSYLASMDHIKQLYRTGRYEAGLIEIDSMIRDFPTDPKLHEMRGTLFDRLGRKDLALRSWEQALRFDPQNQSLRKFIERRGGRIPASQASASEVTP
jgi:hypothetical protein